MSGKILVSACLLGQPVRYDGKGKAFLHPLLESWRAEGRLVSFCPEVSAGMPVPRPPAEISDGLSGEDVLAGRARVIDLTGADLTEAFLVAAEQARETAERHGCRHALLIDGSPSCGSLSIYDGSFSGRKLAGNGVTAALLARSGIRVYAPVAIQDLEKALSSGLNPPGA